MTIPTLIVAQQGTGVVSGDQLNTYVQAGALLVDLRGFIGQANMVVLMIGTTAPNDGGQGVFYWNPGTGFVDDGGVTTIVPPATASGAWLRLALH
jgi:arabinogalactan endo-1,4-beta-galactosidase